MQIILKPATLIAPKIAFGERSSTPPPSPLVKVEQDNLSLSQPSDITKPQPVPEKIAVGAKAPDFTLKSNTGKSVRLYDELDKGPVVLFFYPKNNSWYCTKQVQAFQENYFRFQHEGARVFGISSDPIQSHQKFATAYDLHFPLLSDPHGTVRKQYEARNWMGLPNRMTFVINPATQRIQSQFSSQTDIQTHIRSALEGLRSIPKDVRVRRLEKQGEQTEA